jgi:hypothetical protein
VVAVSVGAVVVSAVGAVVVSAGVSVLAPQDATETASMVIASKRAKILFMAVSSFLVFLL